MECGQPSCYPRICGACEKWLLYHNGGPIAGWYKLPQIQAATMARLTDVENQHDKKGIVASSLKGSDSDQDDHVELINASGHVQELDRSFGVWSICAMSVSLDNAWVAGAGTLVRCL